MTSVSIHAEDLEASVAFYTGVFGMERAPAPDPAAPDAWLLLGDQELHLFRRTALAPEFRHFGLAVDDFDAVYRRLKQLGDVERDNWFFDAHELGDGSVELYVRDPAGHLVEVDWPDVATLDPSVVGDIRRRNGVARAC